MDKTPETAPAEQATTHFGYRQVPTGQKQKLVGQVFSSVARRYDLMNDLMSFGIHRAWKRYFVGTSGVRRGDRVLDLAGGTGDIASLLHARVGDAGEVVLGDINGDMLRVGRDRLTDRGLVRGLERVGGFGGKSDLLARSEVIGGSPDAWQRQAEVYRKATPDAVRSAAREWLSDGVYVLNVEPFPEYRSSSEDVDRSVMPTPMTR